MSLMHGPLQASGARRVANSPGPTRQAGMSLVELLVGIAIGLLVVAGASMLTATQLGENRRMLAETQLQQDLRATTEIITRELRRSGSPANQIGYVSTESVAGVDAGLIDDMTPNASPDSTVTFRYSRGVAGELRFTLSGNKIRTRIMGSGGSGLQDLTDSNTMEVTNFTVTPRHAIEPSQTGAAPQRMPCPKICSDDTTDCWPTVRVREFTINITGRSKTDPSVERTLQSIVRVRNDQIVRTPAPAGAGSPVCPA
jgi:prepilin-type N-terminal cleavage/methylation domain-containing protein